MDLIDPSLSETIRHEIPQSDNLGQKKPTRGAGREVGRGSPGKRLKSAHRKALKQNSTRGISLKAFVKTVEGEDPQAWVVGKMESRVAA